MKMLINGKHNYLPFFLKKKSRLGVTFLYNKKAYFN